MTKAKSNSGFSLVENEPVFLPLTALKIAEGGENVRKAKTNKKEDARLKASIKAVGILKNLLIAVEADSDGRHPVYGGQRRYSCAMELFAEGDWPDERLVLCTPKKRDEAEMLSTMENIHEPMHPADEFMAYKAMADKGLSIDEIAIAFGESKGHVKRLLRLSSVEPTIVEAFREGKLGMEAVIAFAITTDQEKQLACYNALKKNGLRAWDVKRYLTGNYLESSAPIVKFVGLQAYKNAGGVTNADFFSKTVYVLDPELIDKLAKEKLESICDKIRAEWKWVEIVDGEYHANRVGRRISGELVGVPQEIEDELAAAEAELDALTDKDQDELTEDDENRFQALEDRIDELNDKKEEFREFTTEQKGYAGCAVCIGHDGELKVVRGLVKPVDDPEKARGGDNLDLIPGSGVVEEKSIESNVLKQDLAAYRLQAFQATLLKQEALMQDLLVFTLAVDVLGRFQFYSSLKGTANVFNAVEIEKTEAAAVIAAAREALNTDWLAKHSESEQFEAFMTLNSGEKRRIMAYCVAATMRAPYKNKEDDIMSWVGEQIGFSVGGLWAPTVNNYFGRIPKKALLAIGEKHIGEDWVKANAGQKKEVVASQLAENEKMKGWIPPSMN